MCFPVLICHFFHRVTKRVIPETHFMYNPMFVVHQYLILGCADISNRTVIYIVACLRQLHCCRGKCLV